MNGYRRPALPVQTYRDDAGQPVDYGQRWAGSPPDDAYSRTSNLQRFASLHTVADSLIEWLQNTFDVRVEESPAVVDDFLQSPGDIIRAVRISPRDPAAAPLTFVLTDFPGVFLHAGALRDFHFPSCGCDTCDDDVVRLADDLEWTVHAVVNGGYSERYIEGDTWMESRLEGPEDTMRSEQTQVSELPEDKVALARTVLPPTGRWSAWR
ncbi:hypothetical protein AC792_08035 [Arthrobacter sp. RIT-PI-e]|uniref:DUF6226 family protein n=1 Tax=Arthrobacter sp. RIT-PI-e TaxID=1681197 RepID=UPI0006A0C96D|nr:DUF6226 family protein [Arthrobacter sp. RIT-PI-e]KNC19066.1 hypothetical protein AC792_08035 [Arthrobacter sp. RIT-PI-e]